MEVLCRIDAGEQKPVVFLRDTINNGKIQVWKGEGNPVYVPLEYYKMTGPLSAADEKALMERYKKATGKEDQIIKIAHRLPRNERPLPNRIAPAAAPVNGQVATDALSTLSAEQIAALAAAGINLPPIFPQVPPAVEKQATGRTKRGGRKATGRAKPIEQQSVPQASSVAQATPADVMAEVVNLRNEFVGRLDTVLSRLTPQK